jgi:disulfide bond formation protein DsbB
MIAIRKWMNIQGFWVLWLTLGITLESVALYYQYVLDEPPCVLCIQFRLLVALLIIVGLLGVGLKNTRLGHSLLSLTLLLTSVGMLERAYQLVGTERGFVLGECSMSLGFPQWFAIDQWIPWLFGVQTTCGYTPIIAWGISMAEGLMAMSIALVIMTTWMLLVSLKRP